LVVLCTDSKYQFGTFLVWIGISRHERYINVDDLIAQCTDADADCLGTSGVVVAITVARIGRCRTVASVLTVAVAGSE